jgi:hypothetical protein
MKKKIVMQGCNTLHLFAGHKNQFQREGVGGGGEMTQTLYAHMNKIKFILKLLTKSLLKPYQWLCNVLITLKGPCGLTYL